MSALILLGLGCLLASVVRWLIFDKDDRDDTWPDIDLEDAYRERR